MYNEVNQKLSMFIDDELSYDETQALLKQVKLDDQIKTTMVRYQAISHALKTEEFQQLRTDFFDNISQQIQQEPAYLLPQNNNLPQPRKKLFAIAASTIAAVVLVGEAVKNHQQSTSDYPVSNTTVASTPQTKPMMFAQKPGDELKLPEKRPMVAEFNDYLQAHNGSVYTNGEVSLPSYAKVASYGRE